MSATGKRPKILLGVTGSVAAVKAPEIAVRLVAECDAMVKVLLTMGGQNFWNKAAEYDPIHWAKLQELLSQKDNASIEIIGKNVVVWEWSVPCPFE